MRYILYLCFAGAAINAFRFSLRSPRPRPFSPRFVKRDEGATWDGDESEEWKDPGGDSSSGGGGVRVPDAILDRLDEEVGGFVTLVAIKTYKTYLKSYNDELTQKFLSRYGDDEVTPDGLSIKTMLKRPWVDYFEKMIRTDALEYKILVRDLNGRGALKGILRGSAFNAQVKDRKRVHHYYIHKLEPRKVASALLTVREDVSTELLADLRCVRLENEEVWQKMCVRMVYNLLTTPLSPPRPLCGPRRCWAGQELRGKLLGPRPRVCRPPPQADAHGGVRRQLDALARPHVQGPQRRAARFPPPPGPAYLPTHAPPPSLHVHVHVAHRTRWTW